MISMSASLVNGEDELKIGVSGTKKKIRNQNRTPKPLCKDMDVLEGEEGYNDEWMIKYDINEKGIGKILLPPSLSVLLQSDKVAISPSSGGLFIRSI
jgi:hypothetical protein